MQNAHTTGDLLTALFEYLIDHIEAVVDEDKSISHSDIARRTISRLDPLVEKYRTPGAFWVLKPFIHSGGTVPAEPRRSDNRLLAFDSILISMCVEWGGVRALCTRTLFVEPKDAISHLYSILVDMLQVCVATLQNGVALKEVHDKVRGYVANRDPGLLQALAAQFGELMDPTDRKVIAADSDDTAKTGEVYSLVLSLTLSRSRPAQPSSSRPPSGSSTMSPTTSTTLKT